MTNSTTATGTVSVRRPPFDQYRSNVHSQNGEDGVIREILRRTGIDDRDRWCVEFGAWDGIYLSNTFALVERGWNAVYIEGDASRFRDLQDTAARFPRITALQAFVGFPKEDPSSLDNLLKRSAIPADFELLSIDVDSYDLDIWESLTDYSPKIVVIEINSSVPPGILWRHTPRTPYNTFSATLNVGRDKGYTLVCHTGNLIFVRNDLVPSLGFDERYVKYPELLFSFDSRWFPDNLFMTRRDRAIKLVPRPLLPLARALRNAVFPSKRARRPGRIGQPSL